MVHGWKGDENAMWLFKQTVPPGVAMVAPRAPLTVEDGGYSWFLRNGTELQPTPPESLLAGMTQLHQFLTELPQLYPIDPTRLVLLGFSQGSTMVNSLVFTYPQLAIGVASLAGLIPDIIIQTKSPNLTDLPVFIAHGTRDDIVPLNIARQTRDLYTRLGAEVIYGEYHTGHKLTMQGMADLKAWLGKIMEL
jgi:phospholipase/carboxylesterase